MKKRRWMIILGIVLICASIGFSVLGAFRIVGLVKDDPFEDIPRYILKVFGLVGLVLLQIFGYGGGITLIVLGCVFGAKEDKKEAKEVISPQVVSEINDLPNDDSLIKYEDIRIEGSQLFIKDEVIDMSNISNVSMKGNEARFKVDLKEYLITCKGSADAVNLVSKIKQYSK